MPFDAPWRAIPYPFLKVDTESHVSSSKMVVSVSTFKNGYGDDLFSMPEW